MTIHPLNRRQQEAIEHGEGPLMVLAGAGTGKTRVLVRRIARLVDGGVPSHQILAVTFTNKAAEEMRHRLRELLGDVADAMWIGTFHATCARILRQHGAGVGLTRHFSIYDQDDQARVIDRILRQMGCADQVSARVVATRFDRARNRGVDPTEPTGTFDDVVAEAYPLYRARLAAEDAADFNDLIGLTLEVLGREPSVAAVLRSKFRHVLVDEFQDTNRVQYQLAVELSRATQNLTVVGDDDQSIYAWRGAEPRNLLDFDRDFPAARVVKLEQNYRSTQVILDAANQVIARNQQRHGKSLWTDQRGGAPIEVYRADDEREEARFVCQAIGRIAGLHGRLDEIAILYRTNAQARVLEEHLRAAAIPAQVIGAASFFDRREIRDVVAYLRLVANPASDTSLERVINVPARGIGEKTVDRIRAAARSGGISLMEAVRRAAGDEIGAMGIGAAARRKLRAFAEVIDDVTTMAERGASVAEILIALIERSGLRAQLEEEGDQEAIGRLDNLADLVSMAADVSDDLERERMQAQAGTEEAAVGESIAGVAPEIATVQATNAKAAAAEAAPPVAFPPDAAAAAGVEAFASGRDRIGAFLERLALASGGGDLPSARSDARAARGAVVLTTIHVAKGLEWPVVFLTGMEDGLFPSLRERDDVSAEDALEEERRLAYVAITRARTQLVLSWSRTRRVWGEIRMTAPSRFLDDVPRGSTVDARPPDQAWRVRIIDAPGIPAQVTTGGSAAAKPEIRSLDDGAQLQLSIDRVDEAER